MRYDENSEKGAHRVMVVFYLVVLIVFIGFKASQNMHADKEKSAVEPTATVSATASADAELSVSE